MKEESRIESIVPAPGWRCYACEVVGQEDGSDKFEITEYPVLGLALVRSAANPEGSLEFLLADPFEEHSISLASVLVKMLEREFKMIAPGRELDDADRAGLERCERERVGKVREKASRYGNA
jgi:hypothetical protein